MKLSDAIRRASELSEAINAYWLRESPKRHPHYPLVYPGEEPPPPPPEEAELEAFLWSLPLDQLHLLVAITEVGKRSRLRNDFAETVEKARREFPTADRAVRRLLVLPPLDGWIEDGLKDLAIVGLNLGAIEELATTAA